MPDTPTPPSPSDAMLAAREAAAIPEEACQIFWSRVDKTPGHGPNGDCWIWQGPKSPRGYGRFKLSKTPYSAPRVSLTLAKGPPPAGKPLSLHSCDNPPCCNPAHLRWGSHADNNRDMIERQRVARHEGRRRGADNPKAKLSADQVRFIRSSELRSRHLGIQFGVSRHAISDIRTGRTWRFLP